MAPRLAFATTLCFGAMAAPLVAQDTLVAGMPDDRYAAIAQTVPGFAGWYWEGTTLVLMLVDTTQRDAAVAAIAEDMRGRYIFRVLVRKADFDFIQLRRWKSLVFADSQITSIGVDEVRNRVLVGVADSAYLAPTRQRLVGLGIPHRALVLEVMRVCARAGMPAVAVQIRTTDGAPAAAGARVILDDRDTAWSTPVRDAVIIHVGDDYAKRHVTVRVDKPWYHPVVLPDVPVKVDECGVVATTLVPVQLTLRQDAPAIRSLYVGRRGLFAGGRFRSRLGAVLDAVPGVSDSVIWSSSDTTVAVVDAQGIMTTRCRKTYRSAFMRATLVADTTVRDSLVMGAGPSWPGVGNC
jgi:hypothetical protein